MKINWPKIRIEIPSPIKDLERMARQLGIGQSVEDSVVEQAAQQLSQSGLQPWQLRALSRVCSRASVIKEAAALKGA